MQKQADQFLHHLQDQRGYSENTVAAYRNDMRQFMTFLARATDGSVDSWTAVDQHLVQAYGTYLKTQAYASSTVARKVASIKSFFSFLIATEQLSDNPSTTFSAPRVERQLPRVLSAQEVERLLIEPTRATTPKTLRDRALLELLYSTGMRVSEIIALGLSDFDAAKTRISCVGRDGEKRQLSLAPQAVESLVTYIEKGRDALLRGREEDRLFVNQRGYPLTRQGLWLIIKSYAEAADLDSAVTPHTLRHSCAVHRLARGADLQKVREMLGHVNISTTQIYMEIASPPDEGSKPGRS